MMIGKKREDGRYYLRGYVDTSAIQKNVYIDFMIDTSQPYTTITMPDAERNNIKFEQLEVQKQRFQSRYHTIDAYLYSNCKIHIPNQRGRPNYLVKLGKVYIPFENISAGGSEANVSRLGLDFLERFKFYFMDGGIVISKKQGRN
jgi:predicted aspartyl protease